MNFEQWKEQVSHLIYNEFNVLIANLPEMKYYDFFSAGIGIHVMANIIISKNKLY